MALGPDRCFYISLWSHLKTSIINHNLTILLDINNFERWTEYYIGWPVLSTRTPNDPEFIYAVHPVSTEQPEFGPSDTPALDENKKATYYRAEVHLSEGGQNYDIMGWSKISVINDVIDHYHKHQHFIHLLK